MSIPFRNTASKFGLTSILIHWISVVCIIGLFAVGLYMTSLSYYDPLYRSLPHLHKSVGVLFAALLVARAIWRFVSPPPAPLTKAAWERWAAQAGHIGLYLFMFLVIVSGYLISTADGRPIEVFNWFSIPATVTTLENQEDIAGEIHEIAAYLLIGLAIFHSLAALKHWLIDKDQTLQRMLWPKSESKTSTPITPNTGED